VTFLIPLFAVLWGWLFLSEGVTRAMLLGGAVIVVGTALATGVLRWRTAKPRTTGEQDPR
jgi:drug/metabolite transporter (DMT)-like permease